MHSETCLFEHRELLEGALMKSFLLGVGVGAIAGLMLAPQEGRRTREAWAERARGWFGCANDMQTQQLDVTEDVPDPVAETLNTATKHELRSIPGIGKATANKIVENRPYETEEQVLEEGILPEKTIEKVKEQLVEEKREDVA
jgi:DNA uptake protein ComE-like DNA-binding protein